MIWREWLDPLLRADARPVEVEPNILTVAPNGAPTFYDRGAGLYDLIVGGRVYNRLVWGCPVANYRQACRAALDSSSGPVIDIGCGSLVFTAETYASVHDRLIVLTDSSIGMLRRARDRLIALGAGKRDNLILLQADAMQLPFVDGAFCGAMSWGVLHVMAQSTQFIHEMRRVTASGGHLALSSLTTDRAFGRGYLSVLQRAGEVQMLASSQEIAGLLGSTECPASVRTTGNMVFLFAQNACVIEPRA